MLAFMEKDGARRVSTCKVSKISEELCEVSFSWSTTSVLYMTLDNCVHIRRKVSEGDYLFILVDAPVYQEPGNILGVSIGDTERYATDRRHLADSRSCTRTNTASGCASST